MVVQCGPQEPGSSVFSHNHAELACSLFPQCSKMAVPGLSSQASQKRQGRFKASGPLYQERTRLVVDLSVSRTVTSSLLAAGKVAVQGFRFSSLQSRGRQERNGSGIDPRHHLPHTPSRATSVY